MPGALPEAGPEGWTEGQLATEGKLCVLGTLVDRETSWTEGRIILIGCEGVQAGLTAMQTGSAPPRRKFPEAYL